MNAYLFVRATAIAVALATTAPVLAADPIAVAVSVLPQKYIVKAIGGDRITVTVMVPPGASPEVYEPKPSQLRALAANRLYFSIGVPFETAWLPRFAGVSPTLRFVPMHRGLHLPESGHKPQGGHTHGVSDDPHLWTSPPMVRLMAATIAKSLTATDPQFAPAYAANYARFAKRINVLDSQILDLFADIPPARRRFLVVHPAWSHFANAYGLEQVAIETDGKEPGPRGLAKTIAAARRGDLRTVFVQPDFPTRTAAVFSKALGAHQVAITPLAANWPQNILEVARKIRASLK
jgi:zinc transport system substrate-binding protein